MKCANKTPPYASYYLNHRVANLTNTARKCNMAIHTETSFEKITRTFFTIFYNTTKGFLANFSYYKRYFTGIDGTPLFLRKIIFSFGRRE